MSGNIGTGNQTFSITRLGNNGIFNAAVASVPQQAGVSSGSGYKTERVTNGTFIGSCLGFRLRNFGGAPDNEIFWQDRYVDPRTCDKFNYNIGTRHRLVFTYSKEDQLITFTLINENNDYLQETYNLSSNAQELMEKANVITLVSACRHANCIVKIESLQVDNQQIPEISEAGAFGNTYNGLSTRFQPNIGGKDWVIGLDVETFGDFSTSTSRELSRIDVILGVIEGGGVTTSFLPAISSLQTVTAIDGDDATITTLLPFAYDLSIINTLFANQTLNISDMGDATFVKAISFDDKTKLASIVLRATNAFWTANQVNINTLNPALAVV